MPKVASWIKQGVSGTPGTSISVDLGTVLPGFMSVDQVFTTADYIIYNIQDGLNRETGVGFVYTGTPWSLYRDTPLETLTAGVYDNTTPTKLSLTSAAIVSIVPTASSYGRVVGTGYAEIATVVTCNAVTPVDDTKPQNSEGVEVITCTYTPIFSDSKVIVEGHAFGCASTTGVVVAALYVDTDVNPKAVDIRSAGTTPYMNLHAYAELGDADISTVSPVFKLRVGCSTGNFYVNGDNAGSRILGGAAKAFVKVTEIRAG